MKNDPALDDFKDPNSRYRRAYVAGVNAVNGRPGDGFYPQVNDIARAVTRELWKTCQVCSHSMASGQPLRCLKHDKPADPCGYCPDWMESCLV